MKNCTLFSLMLLFAACNSHDTPPRQTAPNSYRLPAEGELKAAIDSTYKSFSYVRGSQLDTAKISSRFIPEAQIIKFEKNKIQVLSVKQFLEYLNQLMIGQGLDSFDDLEIYGKTEQFGKIAHRISTYKLYVNTKDTIAQKGVNSFQLLKTPVGWRISSMTWDTEGPSQRIPDYYLSQLR